MNLQMKLYDLDVLQNNKKKGQDYKLMGVC